jgi:hypothetical protein
MNVKISLADFPQNPTMFCPDPPNAHHIHQLPLDQLPWDSFERLCVRLAKTNSDAEHTQAFGIRGQAQEGIDLYLRNRSNGRYVVWQCKRHKSFDKSKLKAAVRTFLQAFKSKEAGIPIRDAETLILAVTADMSDVAIAKELERLAQRLRKLGIRLIAHDLYGLSDELKKHRELVEDFFSPAMADAFCGMKLYAGSEDRSQMASLQTALRCAQEGLSSSGNDKLDYIRNLWGERRDDQALDELSEFKRTTTWPMLSPEVQAKAIRLEAGLKLLKGDAATARQLFEEARAIAPDANARALEAKLIYHDSGAQAALAFLDRPQTDDERVLRWSMLLELGRPKDVTSEFAALTRACAPAGDFAAVLAHAQLAQFDVVSADRTVHAALHELPRHVSSRYVSGLVDYYWGISTSFLGWQHMTWPVPPQWNLVKRDDLSVERRRRAAQTFAELSATALGRGDHELKAWQLACIALNSSDREQANELVRSCLSENPAHLPVIVWATALGLEFDRARSITVLKQRLEAGDGSLDELLALLGLLDESTDIATSSALLDRHQELFADAGREHLLYLHRAQLLIAQDKIAETNNLLASLPEMNHRLQIHIAILSLLSNRTRQPQDYQRLANMQEEQFGESKSSETLLACCQTHRFLRQWEFIAQHAGELVAGIGTQSALELGAEGLLHCQKARECLTLLESNRGLCAHGDWTPFLRQLAAECHRLLTDLPAAIGELERAVTDGGGVPAMMQLFRSQLHKGDIPASLQTARSLSKHPDVPPEFLVAHVIPIARHNDEEMAKSLVQRLAHDASGLSPQAKAKLVDEGYRLGLESLVADLLRKLMQDSVDGKGPLKALTFEETKQIFADERKTAEELWGPYRRGEIPIHFVVARLNLPISRVFHEVPRKNLKNPYLPASPAVFTRYASEANWAPVSLAAEVREIFLDISSLLLLDALELLPKLEAALDHIYIGTSLVASLECQLDQLSSAQPARDMPRRQVVELIDSGLVQIADPTLDSLSADSPLRPLVSACGDAWCQRLAQFRENSGLLIEFLPLHPVDDVTREIRMPDEFAASVCSPRQLIEAAGKAGWLGSHDIQGALECIGQQDSGSHAEVSIHAGMMIHLGVGLVEELARVNVLKAICEKANVTLDGIEADRVREEAKRTREKAALKQVVQRILGHVSAGIETGKYRVFVGDEIEGEDRETKIGPECRCLLEAVHFSLQQKLPICVDDRMVRRHLKMEDAPLCDSWDVLHWLKNRGAITEGSFQGFRSTMRKAKIHYLPVGIGEVMESLFHAPIQDGVLQETSDLACLRRYVAATLHAPDGLQGPIKSADDKLYPREAAWVARLQSTFSRVLVEVWTRADLSDKDAEARADWVWHNLWFDQRVVPEVFGQKSLDYSPTLALGQSIGFLFSLGISLSGSPLKKGETESRRQRFFQWIMDRAVQPHLPNIPSLFQQIAPPVADVLAIARNRLQEIRNGQGNRDLELAALRNLIGFFYLDLPPELLDACKLKASDLQEWGLTSSPPPIEVLGVVLPSAEFWEAIARALRQSHSTLWNTDRKTALRFKYDDKAKQIQISAKGVINHNWSKLNVPFLQLLSDSPRRREASLRSEAKAFDVDEPKLGEIIREILSAPTAAQLVARRDAHRNKSATAKYDEIPIEISSKKSIPIVDLIPEHSDCLIQYLRLDINDRGLEEVAKRLLQRLGWIEATVRLSRQPTKLPEVVLSEWQKLSSDEQESRLRDLELQLVSPLERIHLIELLCNPASATPTRLSQAKKHLTWLFDQKTGLAEGQAMLAAVRWSQVRLGWHPATSHWPPFVRMCLSWSHGCAVHRAFQIGKASPESVRNWFKINSQELLADYFDRHTGIIHDAANPATLKYPTLLIKGLVAACGDLSDLHLKELGIADLMSGFIGGTEMQRLADMWADRTLGGNFLGTFLSSLPDDKLRRTVGETTFNERLRLQPQDLAKLALEALRTNPNDATNRKLLQIIIAERPIYAEVRDVLPELLTKFDFVARFKSDPDDCQDLMLLASRLAAGSGDPALVVKVWAESIRLAQYLASQSSASENTRNNEELIALSLADVAIRLSASAQSRTDGLSRLTMKLMEVQGHWPGFCKHMGSPLDQIFSKLPAEESGGYAQRLFLFRSW